MIVRLEVTASEKIAARSQYEPNHYSVLISVEQLELGHSEELLGQADTLFRRAKEAIANAKRADGLTVTIPQTNGAGNGHSGNGRPGLPATDKQMGLIQTLRTKAGLAPDELERLSVQSVGEPTENLDRFGASRLIGALQHVVRSGGA